MEQYAVKAGIFCRIYVEPSLMPIILDVILPKNESRDIVYIFPAYYIIDDRKYRTLISVHMACVCFSSFYVFSGCDASYMFIVQHACGQLAVTGHDASWYNANKRTQLLFVLVIRSCLNPPTLSAGGLFTMNLESFFKGKAFEHLQTGKQELCSGIFITVHNGSGRYETRSSRLYRLLHPEINLRNCKMFVTISGVQWDHLVISIIYLRFRNIISHHRNPEFNFKQVNSMQDFISTSSIPKNNNDTKIIRPMVSKYKIARDEHTIQYVITTNVHVKAKKEKWSAIISNETWKNALRNKKQLSLMIDLFKLFLLKKKTISHHGYILWKTKEERSRSSPEKVRILCIHQEGQILKKIDFQSKARFRDKFSEEGDNSYEVSRFYYQLFFKWASSPICFSVNTAWRLENLNFPELRNLKARIILRVISPLNVHDLKDQPKYFLR
ncbi:hypothetical protein WN51_13424 [Melipona quadrifasciata]|uniref:Uncharacterized protein n=1 Tax=Melipona quadrifasciata TaxID=166423 RepID=A0A0M9A189_9HYME|nr:hypothetical protein WN51_13424 [Melipona quadrifasciata]